MLSNRAINTIYSPQNCLVSSWVCTTLPFLATDIVLGKEAPDWLCALVLSTASWFFLVFLPIVGTWSIASTTWPERGFQSNFLTTAYGCQKHVLQSIPEFVLLKLTLPQSFAARKLLTLLMKQSTARFNAFVRDNSFKFKLSKCFGGTGNTRGMLLGVLLIWSFLPVSVMFARNCGVKSIPFWSSNLMANWWQSISYLFILFCLSRRQLL